jgi:hypothetical protein
MRFTLAAQLVVAFSLVAAPALAAEGWQRFADPAHGYAIDLPVGSFSEPERDADTGLFHLSELAGDGLIEIYSGVNPKGLPVSDFADELSQAERIADVTYRAEGKTWFVLSGHYRREADERQDLIYYAKFVFTPDHTRFAAFEISYPLTEKLPMDPVVAHLQRSLRIAMD